MRLRTMVAVSVALLTASAAFGGAALDTVRSEVASCRSALATRPVLGFKTLNLLNAAQERFAQAIELLDGGDPDRLGKAFTRIGAGMKKMEKAAKAEGDADLNDFVADWESRLWLAASSVFKAADIVVGGSGADPALQEKLTKKMARPAKLVAKGRPAAAVKKLARAWKVQKRINADP